MLLKGKTQRKLFWHEFLKYAHRRWRREICPVWGSLHTSEASHKEKIGMQTGHGIKNTKSQFSSCCAPLNESLEISGSWASPSSKCEQNHLSLLGNWWHTRFSSEEAAECLRIIIPHVNIPKAPPTTTLNPQSTINSFWKLCTYIPLFAPFPRGHSWLIQNFSTSLKPFKLVNGVSVTLISSRL